MNHNQKEFLTIAFLDLAIFAMVLSLAAPSAGTPRALLIAGVTTFFASVAIAVAFLYGVDVGKQTPVQRQTVSLNEIVQAVLDALERAEMVYDPELLGPRLTAVQAELAKLSQLVTAMLDALGRRTSGTTTSS